MDNWLTYYLLLFLVLLGFCQTLEDTLITWINGSSEDGPVSGWLSTPGFPGVSFTHWAIHSYMLYNTYPEGRVQITCTDFDTPDEDFMYLKIYDGDSYSSSPSYVFGYGSNPVFHSTGRVLRLVFKPGHSNWWDRHRGIHLKYNFISYDREDWEVNNMPSTGFCPFVGPDDIEGQMRIVGVPYNGQYYPLDCHWVLRNTDGMVYVNIIQISFDSLNGSHSVEFRSGYSGGELLATFSSTPPYSQETVAVVYDISAVYVHLYGSMENSIIEFAYSNSHPSVTNLYSTFANHPLGECPYKPNLYPHGVSPECLNYWDVQYYSDASCDTYHYLNTNPEFQPDCTSTARCYGAHDTCDGFDDCGSNEEELECPEEDSEHMHIAGAIFIAFVFFLACVCGENRGRFMQAVRAACQACSEACSKCNARIKARCNVQHSDAQPPAHSRSPRVSSARQSRAAQLNADEGFIVSSSHELDVATTYFLLLGAMLLIFLVLKTKLDHIRRTSGSLSWRTVGAECRRGYERCIIVICGDSRRLTRVQKFFAPYCKCLGRRSSSSNNRQNGQPTDTEGRSQVFRFEDPGGTDVGDRSSVTVILSAHILLDELRQARERPSVVDGEEPPAYDETWLHTSPTSEDPSEPPPPSYEEAILRGTSGDSQMQPPPPPYESLS